MTEIHRVGPKGQVVIPKRLRDAIGLEPGDEVEFSLLDGKAVRVEPAGDWRRWKGAFAGRRLIEDLEAEHRAELEYERRQGS
jgi:AbrB family looped-hinge helix DNA binding protein